MIRFRSKPIEIKAVRYMADAASMLDIADLVHGKASKIVPCTFHGVAMLIIVFADEEVAVKHGEWLVDAGKDRLDPWDNDDLMRAFDEVK